MNLQERLEGVTVMCNALLAEVEESETYIEKLEQATKQLESRRDILSEQISSQSASLLQLQQQHETTELGHRQRLADLELSVNTAETRLTDLRTMSSRLSEIVAGVR